MSVATFDGVQQGGGPVSVEPNYLTKENTVASWFLTKDHKRIALMFFASITFFFLSAGLPPR